MTSEKSPADGTIMIMNHAIRTVKKNPSMTTSAEILKISKNGAP